MPETYQLFQYDSCPFCYRVRVFLGDASLQVPLRDTMRDPGAYRELLAGGGSPTVPCLRIERGDEVEWLYESLDIINYLQVRSNNGRSPASPA
jgi:glutathione S-transferase